VLPNIEAEDRFAFDAGDSLATEGAVLIRRDPDREFLIRADIEPCPAGTKTRAPALAKSSFELREAAEL